MTPPFIDALREVSSPLGGRDEERAPQGFGDNQPVGRRIGRTGIRDLLRDTALLVTTLAQGGKAESVTALRERCQQLMTGFACALERRGMPADVREDALYAQCGLLDEAVLRSLPVAEKPQWDAQPLQVERFGKHDAGERIFERITVRMGEPRPNADLLECYSAILGLGFMGRYASPAASSSGSSLRNKSSTANETTLSGATRAGENARAALIASLDEQLRQLRPAIGSAAFVSDRAGKRLTDWFWRLSPWTIAAMSCAAAVLAYFAWGRALDLQLSYLLSAKP